MFCSSLCANFRIFPCISLTKRFMFSSNFNPSFTLQWCHNHFSLLIWSFFNSFGKIWGTAWNRPFSSAACFCVNYVYCILDLWPCWTVSAATVSLHQSPMVFYSIRAMVEFGLSNSLHFLHEPSGKFSRSMEQQHEFWVEDQGRFKWGKEVTKLQMRSWISAKREQ